MHDQPALPPIRITLGSRLYTAGDLFLGILALLVLDAIIAWIVWSAFSNAVYLIAAVFAVIGIALALLGIAIKRRAKADGKRRHQARLILEAAGPHTPDEEIDQLVWAWLIYNKASRQEVRAWHESYAEAIENRIARPISRLWIINDADGLATREPINIPSITTNQSTEDIGQTPSADAQENPTPPDPLDPSTFACWPTYSGRQLKQYRFDDDPATTILAGVFCAVFGILMLLSMSFVGLALLLAGFGFIHIATTHKRTARLTGGWAIATRDGQGWIVRIVRRRVTEAYPIDHHAVLIVTPSEHRPLFRSRLKAHRARIIIPADLGPPLTTFEADGLDLPTIAQGMGVHLDIPSPSPSPHQSGAGRSVVDEAQPMVGFAHRIPESKE